ncbi:hypothetical protein F8M41_012657 [Gigaspora margarita]|uniref:Uncharacterized protein n=1 Tax=Gigaspora margarita TaxID=4874 RepID=A0A8H4AT46_GIGMA|nr:hypothetical protein F8M41_012657 [Gigaspora margarita]
MKNETISQNKVFHEITRKDVFGEHGSGNHRKGNRRKRNHGKERGVSHEEDQYDEKCMTNVEPNIELNDSGSYYKKEVELNIGKEKAC